MLNKLDDYCLIKRDDLYSLVAAIEQNKEHNTAVNPEWFKIITQEAVRNAENALACDLTGWVAVPEQADATMQDGFDSLACGYEVWSDDYGGGNFYEINRDAVKFQDAYIKLLEASPPLPMEKTTDDN